MSSSNCSEVAAGGEEICKAAAAGERQEVLRLMRRGLLPEQRDLNGVTPIFRAAAGGHQRIVDDLVQAGASVNVTNSQGGTGRLR